jgi:nucleotide-binding universal stress UspA family protein
MATHGRSGLGRAVLGSVADEVLRHAPVPVLLVPAARAGAWPASGPLRVLVPLDGSDFALEALGPVRRLAGLTGADVTLLRAVEPPDDVILDDDVPLPVSDMESEVGAARRYLEGVAGTLSAAARRVSVVATIGSAAEAIAEHVRNQPVDLIAMATHGRGGFARVMLGSVAGQTLRRAGVPLLLVRPAGLRVPAEEYRAAAAGESQRLALTGAG